MSVWLWKAKLLFIVRIRCSNFFTLPKSLFKFDISTNSKTDVITIITAVRHKIERNAQAQFHNIFFSYWKFGIVFQVSPGVFYYLEPP